MSHRLYERNIGVEHVFQNIFRVTGRRYSEDFELRILRLHLPAQILEHFDGVLNRITVRELVGLAQNLAVIVEQNGLGGCGAAVDANKSADRLILSKRRGDEGFAPIRSLERIEF